MIHSSVTKYLKIGTITLNTIVFKLSISPEYVKKNRRIVSNFKKRDVEKIKKYLTRARKIRKVLKWES